MRFAWLPLLAACASEGTPASFVIDSSACTITSNRDHWVGCRAYWSATTRLLAIQTMTARTTGSFAEPSPDWFTWTVDPETPAGARLTATGGPGIVDELAPGTFAFQSFVGCAPVVLAVDTLTLDPERRTLTFAGSLEISCNDPRFPQPEITSFQITARGATAAGGAPTDVDGPIE